MLLIHNRIYIIVFIEQCGTEVSVSDLKLACQVWVWTLSKVGIVSWS